MKALSVKQPWAGLIASGYKNLEIRNWFTLYRGDLLIVSSKKPSKARVRKEYINNPNVGEIIRKPCEAFGYALCVVSVTGCIPYDNTHKSLSLCDWKPGLFAWRITDVRNVMPFPVKGKLRLFDVDDKNIRYLSDLTLQHLSLTNGLTEKIHTYAMGLYRKALKNGYSQYANFGQTLISIQDLLTFDATEMIQWGFTLREIESINVALGDYFLPKLH